MTRARLRALIGFAGAAVVMTTAVAPAGAAGTWAEPTKSHPPAGSTHTFTGVDMTSPTTAIAVGYRVSPNGGRLDFRTHAQRFNGTRWTTITTLDRPGNPSRNLLLDVDALSRTNAWAVGWSQFQGLPEQTFIQRWDGLQFQIHASPSPGDRANRLHAVSARNANDVWAVGYQRSGAGSATPLALRWNGSAWAAVNVPTAAYPDCTGGAMLTGVATVPGSKTVWASGVCVGFTEQRGVLMSWTGSKWVTRGRHAIPDESSLEDVAARSADEVWAVGSRIDERGKRVDFALRLVNGVWRVVPTPVHKDMGALVAVAIGPTGVWAVGRSDSTQIPNTNAQAIHWDGSRWTDESPGLLGALNDVADGGPTGLVTAVGAAGEHPSGLLLVHEPL